MAASNGSIGLGKRNGMPGSIIGRGILPVKHFGVLTANHKCLPASDLGAERRPYDGPNEYSSATGG